MTFVVHTIPAFSDNYIWLIQQKGSLDAFVVDPGDAYPVLDALSSLGLHLAGILVTHQHPDHIGGIPKLLKHYNVPVYGPADISLVTHPLSGGEQICIAGANFELMAVPGHTLNHLAYFSASEQQAPVLFCGDTLFACGCGRLFEGTPQQMYDSLRRFSQLPSNTQIYCAHEYTLANLHFALAVDPDNNELQQRLETVQQLRQADKPTVPFTLAEELKSNPFLRTDQPAVIAAAEKRGNNSSSSVDVFASIRRWKDQF